MTRIRLAAQKPLPYHAYMQDLHDQAQITFSPRVRKSPFFEATLRHGARSFTVYNHMYMPTAYAGMVAEYWSLVRDVTLWDVSCERQVEITGPDAEAFVQCLTPRDIASCAVGRCVYLLLTDAGGGIVNDAVMLRLGRHHFWLSAGDGDVLLWALGVAVHAGLDVRIGEPDVSPLQLQGPRAPAVMRDLFGEGMLDLQYYRLRETELDGIPLVVSRTGWSGELGYELYLRDASQGDALWERVMAAGQAHHIAPAAPNTIRSIEGGLMSYDSDLTRTDNPFLVDMPWLVDLDKPGGFIGQAALRAIHENGPRRRLVGVFIDGPPLAAPNEEFWPVLEYADGKRLGHLTRCVHSPRLEQNIGWANLPVECAHIGAGWVVDTPHGPRDTQVCKAPWFEAHKDLPVTSNAPA